MIEITAIGGYNEVGKNMTAMKVDDEVVIFDMGVYLPKIVGYEEELEGFDVEKMVKIGAIPDDSCIKEYKDKVKAIVIGHAHLDHSGGTIYHANKYKAPIIGTPFTIEVIKTISKEKDVKLKNELKAVNPNSKIRVSKNILIEFINMTHSTPQTAMVAVHTPEGVVLYANDFKFDNHPVLGNKPNYEKLKSLKNVVVLIVDSLYAAEERKTPSEKVASEMLKDVLLGTENKGHAVIITTFSSHLARLKSIIEFGKRLKRKIVFLGRSLNKYIHAAENVGIVKFSKEVEIVAYRSKIKRKLKEIEKQGRSKYLIVCTGGQGEPNAVLSRMVKGGFFEFLPDDHVIFSCTTIPVEPNISNRKALEEELKRKGVRIFTEIHSSGHAAREDLRDLIKMVKPKHVIPAHGDHKKLDALKELAFEMGYSKKEIHVLNDGEKVELS